MVVETEALKLRGRVILLAHGLVKSNQRDVVCRTVGGGVLVCGLVGMVIV